MSELRIFIGYDRREIVTYHVCVQSILETCSIPVSITPLVNLPFDRPREPEQSTDFAFSRFLVPSLCGFEGWALFMDCDMLVRADLAELLDYTVPALWCVQHDYVPRDSTKFLGQRQSVYPRKNWSSFMWMDCAFGLEREDVELAPGSYLHQFKWLRDESIHALPAEWNHLVGEYDENPRAKVAHFTRGSPCFEGYEDQEFSDEWFACRDRAFSPNGCQPSSSHSR